MFDAEWDIVKSLMVIVGGSFVVFALFCVVAYTLTAPGTVAHERELREGCEKRGGQWVITSTNDRDGDTWSCVDKEGHGLK